MANNRFKITFLGIYRPFKTKTADCVLVDYKPKILHLWDQAGVSCILAKYQRKIGYQVEVIKTT